MALFAKITSQSKSKSFGIVFFSAKFALWMIRVAGLAAALIKHLSAFNFPAFTALPMRITAKTFAMLSCMVSLGCHKLKIVLAIIKPVAVFMMNYLGLGQLSSEESLHDMAVLKNSFPLKGNNSISVMVDRSTTIKPMILTTTRWYPTSTRTITLAAAKWFKFFTTSLAVSHSWSIPQPDIFCQPRGVS